jgi:hypothetical protein
MVRASDFQKGRNLTEDETVDATRMCPICGSEAPRRAVVRLQRDPAISLLRCSCCGGCSASRMPRPEVLTGYYEKYYQAAADHAVTLQDVPGFAGHIVRSMPRLRRNQPLRILDFGGGDGSLSLAIAAQLRQPVGITLVDYVHPSRQRPTDVKLVWHRTLDEVTGPYDLVLASAILEHIPDLRPALNHLLGLMGLGGYFYARTPYVVPFARIVPSFDFTYPGHVHDLGPAFWNRIPETFGSDARIVASRPARVETTLKGDVLRTVAAHILKLPSRLEVALRGQPLRLLWPFVAGWEVVLRKSRKEPANAAPAATPLRAAARLTVGGR